MSRLHKAKKENIFHYKVYLFTLLKSLPYLRAIPLRILVYLDVLLRCNVFVRYLP